MIKNDYINKLLKENDLLILEITKIASENKKILEELEHICHDTFLFNRLEIITGIDESLFLDNTATKLIENENVYLQEKLTQYLEKHKHLVQLQQECRTLLEKKNPDYIIKNEILRQYGYI